MDLNWGNLKIEDQAELVLGWRPSPGHIKGAAVELSTGVAKELAKVAKSTLKKLSEMDRRPYSEALALEIGEQYAALSTGALPSGTTVSTFPSPADQDSTFTNGSGRDAQRRELSEMEILVSATGLEALSIEDLKLGHYLFYAVIGRETGTDVRIGFVRQIDPVRVERQSFIKAIMGQEGLQKLVKPIFVFEDRFDVIVAPSEIAILRLEPFNRVFADLAPIIAAANSNAKALAQVLTTMEPSATVVLAKVAASRPSLARRLQRLARPGAMPTVSPTQLSGAMVKHGLNPKLLVKGSKIDFTENEAIMFLDMMEQLYYETDFTHEHRRADRFSPIP